MKSRSANFIAFDIGSSKIAAIAANISKQGDVKVVNQLLHYSKGFSGGSITNLRHVEESIVNAIYELEKSCDKSIKQVTTSLSGIGVKSYYVKHTIKLGNQPISVQDIKKLIQKCLTNFKIKNQQIIHYFPLEFTIDQNNVVDDPTGMYAQQLGCQLHIIAANSLMLMNLTSCFAKCNVGIENIMLAIYSSGLSCLSEDEKELGSIVIDIGSQTTGFAAFFKGKIVYAGCIPTGSFHITSDIAKTFSINIDTAEKLKILYGNAMTDGLDKDKIIRLDNFEPDNGYDANLSITTSELAKIINPKVTEIFSKIKKELDGLSIDHLLARRVVITGGGASLQGIRNLAASVFNKQVRIADPEHLSGFTENHNPYVYSSAVGIIKEKALQYQKNYFRPDGNHSWVKKTFSWIKENI